jgi:hypothetical protein
MELQLRRLYNRHEKNRQFYFPDCRRYKPVFHPFPDKPVRLLEEDPVPGIHSQLFVEFYFLNFGNKNYRQ